MLDHEDTELIQQWCKSNGTDPFKLDEDDKHAILSIIKSEPTWKEWFGKGL